MKGKPNHNIWQRTFYLCRRIAAFFLESSFSIILVGVLFAGCEKQKRSATNSVHLGTNQIGLVSIGVLNTVDAQRQKAIMQFFASNGVPCFIEGSVIFDVMVQQSDVQRVQHILKTNRPLEIAFRSAWDTR